MAVVVVAAGVAARLCVGDRPVDYDSANYAYVATGMMADGISPFALFNNKPPGIYYWYWLCFSVFGNGPLACHLTSIVPDLVVIALLDRLGRRLAGGDVGSVAAALYATLAPAVRMSGEGYTESPLTMLALLAAWLLIRHDGAVARPRRAFCAGVVLAAATLFKQPAFLLAASTGAWAVGREDRARRSRTGLALAAGFVVVQVAVAIWLVATDQLGVFVQRVFLQGASRGYGDGFDVATRAEDWLRLVFLTMPILAPLALAALCSGRCAGTRGFGSAFLLPILGMGLVSYELYDHYLIPALPAVCLLASEWLTTEAPGWRRRFQTGAVALVQGLSVLVLLADLPPRGTPIEPALAPWRARPLTLTYQLRVAELVRAVTTPSEPILSTGSEIPYLAGRRNAYRFLGVAPYLGRLDPVGFSDFPAVAERVRVLALERWRMRLLPADWVAELDSSGSEWHRVADLDHPELLVYVRPRPAPTIDNP